jgi:hypothetical protein
MSSYGSVEIRKLASCAALVALFAPSTNERRQVGDSENVWVVAMLLFVNFSPDQQLTGDDTEPVLATNKSWCASASMRLPDTYCKSQQIQEGPDKAIEGTVQIATLAGLHAEAD